LQRRNRRLEPAALAMVVLLNEKRDNPIAVECPELGGAVLHTGFYPQGKVEKSKRPLVILVTLTVSLMATSIGILFFSGANKVNVYAWDREISLSTRAETVSDVLKEANLFLGPGDMVVPSLETEVSDDMSITIERGKPIFIHWRGKILPILVAERSISKILLMANVTVDSDDVVYPGLDADVPDDRTIRVVKITYGEVRERQEIPYETTKREDTSLDAGLTRAFSYGSPGVMEILYEVKYEDGVEVLRTEKSRTLVKEPIACVMLVGARYEVFRDGQNIRFKRALEASSTAYCPCSKCCGPYATGKTATGVTATKGIVSVDPNVIPLGTRLYVEGYGFAVAADVGSRIKGNRIDVCFDTHDEALAWGRKTVKVYILP